ncbi:MAG: hypothetical protein HY986_02390 [Candidatus Melainabacteria bacterium]|nr:hypothetical protein [Candidatus Melainabacteria bacterium]
MRIFSMLGNGLTEGVKLTRTHEQGDLVLPYRSIGAIAKVSAADFAEMLNRGHASDEPQLEYSYSAGLGGMVTDTLGGPHVKRCAVSVSDGQVWLVPEPEMTSSNGIILAYQWDFWTHECGECLTTGGAEIISRLDDKQWHRQAVLVRIPPDSGISVKIGDIVSVPGSKPSLCQPFRKEQFQVEFNVRREFYLSADGRIISL